MWNVFQKEFGQANANVIEEYQVLRDLAHVAHVRHHCEAVLVRHQRYHNALCHSARSDGVYLIGLAKHKKRFEADHHQSVSSSPFSVFPAAMLHEKRQRLAPE